MPLLGKLEPLNLYETEKEDGGYWRKEIYTSPEGSNEADVSFKCRYNRNLILDSNDFQLLRSTLEAHQLKDTEWFPLDLSFFEALGLTDMTQELSESLSSNYPPEIHAYFGENKHTGYSDDDILQIDIVWRSTETFAIQPNIHLMTWAFNLHIHSHTSSKAVDLSRRANRQTVRSTQNELAALSDILNQEFQHFGDNHADSVNTLIALDLTNYTAFNYKKQQTRAQSNATPSRFFKPSAQPAAGSQSGPTSWRRQ